MTAGAVPSRFLPGTLGHAVDRAAAQLADAGIDTARLDARVLACRALARDGTFALTHPETGLSETELDLIDRLIARRAAREPMSLILGEREFWSMTFTVTRATLTPRPETETLVEEALAWAGAGGRLGAPLRVLDLGTGTGCLLIALLSELPAATGLGVDLSEAALAVAAENAARLGVGGRARFARSDWGRDLAGPFDLIVANPPYIAEAEALTLPPEVRGFDPPAALFAGPDGLAAYRAIAPQAARLAAPGAAVIVELGAGQADAVAVLFARAGLPAAGLRADLAGVPRAARFTRPEGIQKNVGNAGEPV